MRQHKPSSLTVPTPQSPLSIPGSGLFPACRKKYARFTLQREHETQPLHGYHSQKGCARVKCTRKCALAHPFRLRFSLKCGRQKKPALRTLTTKSALEYPGHQQTTAYTVTISIRHRKAVQHDNRNHISIHQQPRSRNPGNRHIRRTPPAHRAHKG